MYIGKIEQVKKEIAEDDGDDAHIDEAAPSVIHYISSTPNHQFLIDKTMSIDEGVTYDVFRPKEEEPKDEADPPPVNL